MKKGAPIPHIAESWAPLCYLCDLAQSSREVQGRSLTTVSSSLAGALISIVVTRLLALSRYSCHDGQPVSGGTVGLTMSQRCQGCTRITAGFSGVRLKVYSPINVGFAASTAKPLARSLFSQQ